ncbi:glucoamylase family protein [Sutcliffiella horikoshii]|uniref:glucoamylase family protein n=1 Tax=Sutcliffiella horikoshii TaxID=79883 RepID=UPI003CF8AC93
MKKLLGLLLISVLVVASVLYFTSTPERTTVQPSNEMEKELLETAEKTFRFFEDYTDLETGLTMDRVDFEQDENKAEHTSPTNIAMYMLGMVSGVELGFISKKEAEQKLEKTLRSLKEMETWNGLYYNWYFTKNGTQKTDWGQFISSVDNGWLTAGLIVTGQYFEGLKELTDPLVEQMDYSTLYDPSVGHLYGGYDKEQESLTPHHYGMLYTEPRVASYLAIGKGDVPEEHWWKLYRTFPPEFDWQSQTPTGAMKDYDGINVFQGIYEYEGIKYVPSWGGSMFEALMPSLVMKENELGVDALGLNNLQHVKGQIRYAEVNELDAWGFSPAAIRNNYGEFGAPVLGTEGYEDKGVVTPHASFLALEHAPEEVYDNLKKLKDMGVYGEDYGYYDTVNLQNGEVAHSYLSLDQGMILASITNYLKKGVIREYFHQDPIGESPEHLLEVEDFEIKD